MQSTSDCQNKQRPAQGKHWQIVSDGRLCEDWVHLPPSWKLSLGSNHESQSPSKLVRALIRKIHFCTLAVQACLTRNLILQPLHAIVYITLRTLYFPQTTHCSCSPCTSVAHSMQWHHQYLLAVQHLHQSFPDVSLTTNTAANLSSSIILYMC